MSGIKDTPLNRQYIDIKQRYPDCIVLFRVGDFYEVFYEDAVTVSRALDIVLTSRQEGQPMAGVPYHAVDRYLKSLVMQGYKVAICEQMEDPRTVKGIVKRDVIKVVTPGTYVEDDKDNYLASVVMEEGRFSYAYADISLGAVMTGMADSESELLACLEKVDISEIIIPEADKASENLIDRQFRGVFVTRYPIWEYDISLSIQRIKDYFGVISLVPFGIHNDSLAIQAVSIILKHVLETQKGVMSNISSIENESEKSYVGIDAKTWQNLEIFPPNSGDGVEKTLYGILDANLTKMGARNLKKWMRYPLKDGAEISKRWEALDYFKGNRRLRDKLGKLFSDIPDFERSMGRISYSKGRPRDLVQVKKGLAHAEEIKEILYDTGVELLGGYASCISPLRELCDLLERSVPEEPGAGNGGMGLIKDNFNDEVDSLRNLKKDSRSLLMEIQEHEKEATGIPSLKVKYNKVFGYFIEVSKSYSGSVPERYDRRQTLTNAERYMIPELKELEEKILNADSELIALEARLFEEVKEQVVDKTREILVNAEVFAETDTLRSFAEISVLRNYVRPGLLPGGALEIIEGRHPVLEVLLGSEPFVPNDLEMDIVDRSMYLVTGPNMAGKSTYLRQNALILLMAQIGCFVPADRMAFTPVDRIFSRVGASDNIAAGESTFMVEMLETSYIVHNATRESFIILDEIGRGTSTYDGLSIAWAISEHVHSRIGAKTLFATHYHELTELTDVYPAIHNLNISVKEWNDSVIFLRKIEEGRADKSYGIQVARLAGLPESVIERAKEILFNLESESYRNGVPSIIYNGSEPLPRQVDLFSDSFEQKVLNDLRYMDLNSLTPIDLMMEVKKIKKRIEEHDKET